MTQARVATAFLAVCLAASVALSASNPTSPIEEEIRKYDARLDEDLRARDPIAADLFRKGNELRNAHNDAEAAEQYRQVLERVPEFNAAIRRMGMALAASGRKAEGVAAVRKAFSEENSPENESALAIALIAPNAGAPLTPAELDEAKNRSRSALRRKPNDFSVASTVCQVAIANEDLGLLVEGVDRLDAIAPNELATHYFNFVRYVSIEDLTRAKTALERARAAGLPEAEYARLSGVMVSNTPWTTRLWKPVAAILSVWVLGAAMLFLLGMALSRATLRAASTMPPTREGSAQGASIRKVYRAILAICCIYYFISLPIVLAFVVLAGGAAIYGFMALGQIPVKIVFIIVIVVIVTLYSAVKSLFIRVRDEDPGERLDLSQEPALQHALQEVARKVGTRSVDNVYMTPGTGIAVMERGGLLKKLRGMSERCLIVGAGALDGLSLAQFKAILAHEYGHFSNRDTAGGGLALAVRRSIFGMAQAMARGGAAAWYNPAWLFLQGFYRLFLFISQGASRLQEILADRWAAFAYGSRAFEEGLRHIVTRSVRFDATVTARVNDAIKQDAQLTNLYASEPARILNESEIEEEVRRALEREPTAFDSHPSPKDRFRWVQALDAPGESGAIDAPAWSLFADRRAIELRMTEQIRQNVHESHGILIKMAAPAP